MTRIEGVIPTRTERRVRSVLEAQAEERGALLLNHLLYARRPSIFRGARSRSMVLLPPIVYQHVQGYEERLDIHTAGSEAASAPPSRASSSSNPVPSVRAESVLNAATSASRSSPPDGRRLRSVRDLSSLMPSPGRSRYNARATHYLFRTIFAPRKFNRVPRVPSQVLWKR